MKQNEESSSLEDIYPEYVKNLPANHPVRIYIEENIYLRDILREMENVDFRNDFQKFFNIFNQLCEVEKHYARKENQLFPFLEKRGWTGPSQGMWAFHDANRDLLRGLRKKIEARELDTLSEDIKVLCQEMQRMILIEEMRLFPISLQLLSEEDWCEMSVGEGEIGWMLKRSPQSYAQTTESGPPILAAVPGSDTCLRLEEGAMTLEQVNFLLRVVPVDLTYVDEHDRVVFYNRGEERVFPRSAGIIGREVRFCHPPKSVATVLRILEEFKSGSKSEAEFWIRFKGRVIHIRYFAVRDGAQNYKGVVEMSQDITDIQKLEGEKRLLDWDPV